MKPPVILYSVYISGNRVFIKNRWNAFQRAPYHQDILIRRNLRRCCNTPPSSFTLYQDTQCVHTGRWCQQSTEDSSVIQFVTNVTVYRNFTSSAFIELLGIFYFIVVWSCLNRHNFIPANLLNADNKLSRSACHRLQAVVRVTAGPRFFIVCNAHNGTVFFHSTQILGLLCSEFFLQYGLRYI